MGTSWKPFFDNLRIYLSRFPGRDVTQLEVTASRPGTPEALWASMHTGLDLGDEGSPVDDRGLTGTVERVGERQTLVRLTAPVPGMLGVFAHDAGDDQSVVGVRGYLFSPDAYVQDQQPAWQAWRQKLSIKE